jgi:hypothetical protein
MSKCRFGHREVVYFSSPTSQDSCWENRSLVRKWLPAILILIGFSLGQVGIGDKTKLIGLKKGPFL